MADIKAQRINVPTPDGRHLEADLATPAGSSAAPGLIIAPGSSYSREAPLIATLFSQAAVAGFCVLRFDWRYTTWGGAASSSRTREVEDLESILEYLQNQPQVEGGKIILGGKSLGAVVAWRVFHEHREAYGTALLTPVFRSSSGAEKHYPGLAQETRPVYLLTGTGDPLNNRQVMESHLQDAGQNLTVNVVAGNHGLEISRRKDGAGQLANQENISSAVNELVSWLAAVCR